jgi:COMPASS component SWD3
MGRKPLKSAQGQPNQSIYSDQYDDQFENDQTNHNNYTTNNNNNNNSNSQSAARLPIQLYPSGDSSDTIIECLYKLSSQESSITCLKFSPCGRYFAMSSAGNLVEIYDINGVQVYRLFGLHLHGINALAWSPCSNYMVLGSDDGFVSIWNINEQLPLLLLKAHNHHVLTVDWSLSGTLIASGSADGSVCLFDTETGSLLRQWEAHTDLVRSVRFSNDCTMLVSSSNDGTVRYWDNGSGFCLKTLHQGIKVGYGQLSLAPRTDLLVAVGCLDGCVRIYDTIQSTCVMLLAGHINTQYSLPLAYFRAPNPDDDELFYHDLYNLESLPLETNLLNATQQIALDNMNDINQFISQELQHLQFQQYQDQQGESILYHYNNTTNANNDQQSPNTNQSTIIQQSQPSLIEQFLPPSYFPTTHSLLNRHEIKTPSGAIINTTNPIIDPMITPTPIIPSTTHFNFNPDPHSSTPNELKKQPLTPFTRITPSNPTNPQHFSTIQSYRQLNFRINWSETPNVATYPSIHNDSLSLSPSSKPQIFPISTLLKNQGIDIFKTKDDSTPPTTTTTTTTTSTSTSSTMTTTSSLSTTPIDTTPIDTSTTTTADVSISTMATTTVVTSSTPTHSPQPTVLSTPAITSAPLSSPTTKTTTVSTQPDELKSTNEVDPLTLTEQPITQLVVPYNHIDTQYQQRLQRLVSRQWTKMLLSGSEDGGICMWNLQTIEEQNQINLQREQRGLQRLKVIAPGELMYKVRAHHDVVGALDCHPFLPLIISGGMDADCCIKMWKYKLE